MNCAPGYTGTPSICSSGAASFPWTGFVTVCGGVGVAGGGAGLAVGGADVAGRCGSPGLGNGAGVCADAAAARLVTNTAAGKRRLMPAIMTQPVWRNRAAADE